MDYNITKTTTYRYVILKDSNGNENYLNYYDYSLLMGFSGLLIFVVFIFFVFYNLIKTGGN